VDRMIRDILDMGRANAMLESSRPAPVDLTHFCQRMVEVFQVSDHSWHEIVFAGPDAGPRDPLQVPVPAAGARSGWAAGDVGAPVWGWLDENLVAPILENLLSNALKYSPEHSRVELGLVIEENWLIFRVQDEGLGIPAGDLQRVGTAFYRSKNVSRFPGTGLGLAMVKLTLNALGGSWEIDSVENVGTTIRVRLPFRPAARPGLGVGETHE